MLSFNDFIALHPELAASTARLVLADDSLQGRAGLHAMLHQPPLLEVAAVANGATELLALCAQHQPQVAVQDLCLPTAKDGLAACRALRQAFPTVRLLVVTGHFEGGTSERVREAGAHGLALKNFSDGLLWRCVLRLAAGKEAFPNPKQIWLPEDADEAQREQGLARCTKAELHLLAALARLAASKSFQARGAVKELALREEKGPLLTGLAYPQTVQKVRDVLESVRKKLHFSSSVDAARWYLKRNPSKLPTTIETSADRGISSR